MSLTAEQRGVDGGEHAVYFYRDDSELAQTVGARLADALHAGATAVLIATSAHARAFEREFEAYGIDLDAAIENGRLILLDAQATLAELTVDGRINGEAFDREVGDLLRSAGGSSATIEAYGEMVDVLWQAGDVPAALELETLWNELIDELGFGLLCAYHSAAVLAPEHGDAVGHVCRLHSTVSSAPGSAVDLHEVSRQFAPEEGAPFAARRLLTDHLRQWGLSEAVVDDARLILSELVSNAVVHARSPMAVSISSSDQTVRLAVRDESQASPMLQPVMPDRQSGRGLQIVAALSREWGFDQTADGKIVWAEL